MRRTIGFLALAVLIAGAAGAAPATWTLQNVTFNDGTHATGSFVYDATTNTYSSVNIQTGPQNMTTDLPAEGGAAPRTRSPQPHLFIGAHYLAANPNFPGPSQLGAIQAPSNLLTGQPMLLMFFTAPLTDAGGTIPLNVMNDDEVFCTNAPCTTFNTLRFLSGGAVNSPGAQQTVPALSDWGLAVMGALLLGTAVLFLRRSESYQMR